MRKQESTRKKERKTAKPDDLGKTKQKSKSELSEEELAKASGGSFQWGISQT